MKPNVTLVAAFLFAACGGDAPGTHTHADGTVHQVDAETRERLAAHRDRLEFIS